MFSTFRSAIIYRSGCAIVMALGLRTGGAAWIGWPSDPMIEELREQWLAASTALKHLQIAAGDMHARLAASGSINSVPQPLHVEP